MFSANFDSSPGSTPQGPSRLHQVGRNETPELASTTPLAPPPSRPFGSSQLGSGVSKLRFSQNTRGLPANREPTNFGLSTASQGTFASDTEGYGDTMDDDYYEDDYEYTQYTNNASLRQEQPNPAHVKSLMSFSTNEQRQPLKKSSRRTSTRLQQYSALVKKGQEKLVPDLANDLKARSHPAHLSNDPDEMIVKTEQLLRSVAEESRELDDDAIDVLLADAAKELEITWEKSHGSRRRRRDEDLSIGPGPDAPPFEAARFVAILILRLHNVSRLPQDDEGAMSMPQILLDWLNEYHLTIETAYSQVVQESPNPTAHDLFWDVVEILTARGKLEEAIRLLGDADFGCAKVDNGTETVDANYTGPELQAISSAVLHLRQLLNTSPSVQSADWRIDGPDWMAYRRDVEAALEDLRDSAETHDDLELLQAEAQDHLVRPGKGLPYAIFQRLQTIYKILLGSANDIIAISQDWLEASILLTVWWNGNASNKVQQWSFDVSRAHHPAQDTALGTKSYLLRLRESFLAVTDPTSDDSWQLSSQSALELALGLALQGDTRDALLMLQTLSQCIAAALAEIGSWSGWISSAPLPDGLDKDDLMVLGTFEGGEMITKDEILEHYSLDLFERRNLQSSEHTIVDGWEIAISVISRCDSSSLASRTVQRYIDELQITTPSTAQRLVTLCAELGMAEESRRVSEQYGDHLVNTGADYGTALLCYARSQAESKVRQLIDVLNSYCLVQSKAYPSSAEMDPALSRLVSNPKQALAGIAEQDPGAVEVLQFYLVGYACLRRYYTVRDTPPISSATNQKKTAAKALVAAITSAADCIYGGLYDPQRQSAIQVDGLLTLLGEATVLTAVQNGGIRVFTSEQLYTILATIEDLETVNDRVYAAIEECFIASMREYHGSQPPSPHSMLKKSISSGTNSNFSFSMMGSEMLAQSSESLGGRSLGSAILVDGQNDRPSNKDDAMRGWDWRAGFKKTGANGSDVLQYLRYQIAEELSIANLEEGFQ